MPVSGSARKEDGRADAETVAQRLPIAAGEAAFVPGKATKSRGFPESS